MPCSPKRARKLLEAGRARVHRPHPFTIRLVDRRLEDSTLQPLALKLDPGSKATGLALVRVERTVDADTGEIGDPVLHLRFLMELVHRGQAIRNAMQRRTMLRRGRRGRKTRYRAPRFDNRTRPEGWLPPSLQHRIETTMTWVARLRRLAPIAELTQELVRFDMQAIQNPEISGLEYQRGELFGYEVKAYLLEKFHRTCQYCDATGVPVEVEHIVPKARGGSNRVSNLTLACRPCNEAKDARDVHEFLAHDPARLARVLARANAPLRDAAAVNTTRWALANALQATGLPLEFASGGRTRFNRARLGIAKSHALDAACVGVVADLKDLRLTTLQVKCNGRGSRSRTRLDSYGFPRGCLMREKSIKGFRTGDRVRADVPKGRKAGVHIGRVAVRRTGSFNIQTAAGVVQGISHKHCKVLMRGDGYSYHSIATPQGKREQGRALRAALSRPAMNGEVGRAI